MADNPNVTKWLEGNKTDLQTGPVIYKLSARKVGKNLSHLWVEAQYWWKGRLNAVGVDVGPGEDRNNKLADALEEHYQAHFAYPTDPDELPF